jgi:hypothetical protein
MKHRPRLALEVLAESLGADLDRDIAPKPGIIGAIDLAHPAFAKLGGYSIVGDRLVNHQLRWRNSDSRARPPDAGHLSTATTAYCLSYTRMFSRSWPCSFFPVCVRVRVFPSLETTLRVVTVTLPPFLDTVWIVSASIRFIVMVSA